MPSRAGIFHPLTGGIQQVVGGDAPRYIQGSLGLVDALPCLVPQKIYSNLLNLHLNLAAMYFSTLFTVATMVLAVASAPAPEVWTTPLPVTMSTTETLTGLIRTTSSSARSPAVTTPAPLTPTATRRDAETARAGAADALPRDAEGGRPLIFVNMGYECIRQCPTYKIKRYHLVSMNNQAVSPFNILVVRLMTHCQPEQSRVTASSSCSQI
jgi:hypothetical protein